jgi:hypothetical protein
VNSFDIVLQNYAAIAKELVAGRVQRRRVPGQPQSEAERGNQSALTDAFPC